MLFDTEAKFGCSVDDFKLPILVAKNRPQNNQICLFCNPLVDHPVNGINNTFHSVMIERTMWVVTNIGS